MLEIIWKTDPVNVTREFKWSIILYITFLWKNNS